MNEEFKMSFGIYAEKTLTEVLTEELAKAVEEERIKVSASEDPIKVAYKELEKDLDNVFFREKQERLFQDLFQERAAPVPLGEELGY